VCTSCHAKRSAAFAEWLNTTVLWPIPHRQIVLTIPKMIRVYFRYDRRLLGKLCRVAAKVITESIRSILGKPELTPGIVICVQTWGTFLNFNPHLHALVSEGGFSSSGAFHVMPRISLSRMEQLFRHRVLKMLLNEGLIREDRVRMLLGWKNSGFSTDASVRIKAGDSDGRENIARYINRAPLAVERVEYLPEKQSVIYRAKKIVKGVNRNFEVFDPLVFLANLTSHIPNRGEHLTRHYGFYSSVKRGQRKKLGLEKPLADETLEIEASPAGGRPSADWARLIRRVYEFDPLVCPACGSQMKVISVIDTMHIIRKILKHLKLWEEPIPRAPPEPEPLDIEYVPFLD
jgi:hypothetical protein